MAAFIAEENRPKENPVTFNDVKVKWTHMTIDEKAVSIWFIFTPS